MEGTAPPADRWFLVEHPGPWDRFVLNDPRFDRTAAAALDRWARAESGRVLFVRRPGRAVRAAQRRWFRVDSRPGHESVRTGLFTEERELADLVTDPAVGAVHDGPLFLVCTHGRHDTCCAVRGRPLAAALAADRADTWESSHIGGCRFAAALVLLPHGVVLGHIPAEDGPGVAARYAAGLLPAAQRVRGRTSLPVAVQAAQHHARLATGADGVAELVPTGCHDEDGGTWRVTFTRPDVTVVLRQRRVDTDRPLTCAATRPGWLRVFDVVAVTVGTPVPS